MLSTRVDMVPEVYLVELAKLQADVPPFSTAEAREVRARGERGKGHGAGQSALGCGGLC